jgi:hypothetical protein
MPLPTPILDDRSYQQLRDELVARIPVYAPEWTDFNASDPGVTLIELFAFLGENLLYRFNQVPEATQLAFLRLLDIPLRPAQPSRALLALTTKDPGPVAPLEKGFVARTGATQFELLREVHPWPVSIRGVAKAKAEDPTDKDQLAFAARAFAAANPRRGQKPVYYVNKTLPLDPAAPDAEIVDFQEAVDGTLWIAVVSEATGFTVAPMLGKTISIGFEPDLAPLSIEEQPPCPGDPATQAQAQQQIAAVDWRVSTGVQLDGAPVYQRVAVAADSTSGLTQQGVVQLELPRLPSDLGSFDIPDLDRRGTGEFPPELEDERLQVLFWIRAARRDASSIGKVLWVGANVVEVEQSVAAAPEFLGTGTAEADQSYLLANHPVLAGTLQLEVEEQGDWKPWREAASFVGAAESDRVFVLDAEAGRVRFGNGVHGRAPQIGERIRVVGYRFGGGAAGNVAAKAISKLDAPAPPTVKAGNPLPARNGADSETIAEALERVPGELRRRDRAVTVGDFQELALMTPGAAVGRADCLPRFDPRSKILDAAGVVTVVVWPREDRLHPDAPVPDRLLLRQVCAWLDARRLVTTELHVIKPTYRTIAVSVGVFVKPGYGVEAVNRWVELVLRQYLAPLPPYGPDGGGWPLGRNVIAAELEAAALQVEGVEYLLGLRLAQASADGTAWEEAPDRTVELQPWEVSALGSISVADEPPRAPGSESAPTPPDPSAVPVLVPTLKETC